MKKKLFIAAALIVVGVSIALLVLTPRAIPEDPLPSQNGYDDFMKVDTLLSASRNEPIWPDMSIEELRSMVVTNHAALELIRVGLTKQCRVVPYSTVATTNDHSGDMMAAKRVAHAFAAASRLAILDGNTNEAAILALDCIRYGGALPHGGVIIDSLVGIADQYIGHKSLEEALTGTDAETARQIVASLDSVIGEREQCDEVFKREAEWARRGRFGPTGFFTQLLQAFLQRGMKAKAKQKFARILNDIEYTKLRAAAHAYELDHGKPPVAAHDLVPQYLKSIPLNSTNGIEMQLN